MSLRTDAEHPLLLPGLFAMTNGLIPLDRRGAERLAVKKHLSGNRFLLRHGASVQMQVQFIIDRSGTFRDVRTCTTRNSWAKSFAIIHDFVTSESEISEGVKMTNAELLGRITELKKSWSPHFETAGNLCRFLSKRPGKGMFTELVFRAFWEEYCLPLDAEKWRDQIPPRRADEVPA